MPNASSHDVELPVFECLRCGHKWSPRKPERPLRCGLCKTPYWQIPAEQGSRVSMGRRKKR